MKKLLTVAMIATFAVPAGASEQTWKVERDVDALRDTETVIAGLVLHEEFDTKGIVVRCKNRNFEVFVTLDEYLDNEAVTVRYRFDDGPIEETTWSVSTNGTATFASNPREIAESLSESSRFVIEVLDYEGTPHQQAFPLKGSAKAISQAENACGI